MREKRNINDSVTTVWTSVVVRQFQSFDIGPGPRGSEISVSCGHTVVPMPYGLSHIGLLLWGAAELEVGDA